MITLCEISRLTNIREEGLKALIASGALPAAHWPKESGNEVGLTIPALVKLKDMWARCVKEMAKAFSLPAGEMFDIVKNESYIFDVADGRVILDEESEAHLIQELLKAKIKGGIL